MKIDKDKFPALFDNNIVLDKYQNLVTPVVIAKMKDVIESANTVRTYLATTIFNPMLGSFNKLIPHRKELHDSCRCLIYTSKAGNPHTIHYILLVEEDRINIMGQIYFIVPNGHDFGMLFSVYVDRQQTEELTFMSYQDVPPIIKIETHDEMLNVVLSAILSAELFINFAEVETKVMKPNTQIWDDKMVRAIYNNKTRNDITVIDSTWYTNLISSGAFKVRGHFRLQPCGPNNSKRKLTWINEFEKEGYNRKAKIEQTVNQNV
jgi:hypothetical protein